LSYFVTGATGFIGRHLVEELLRNREGDVVVLVREDSREKLDALLARWPHADRVKPVAGAMEFAKENLSVAAHLVSGYLSRKPKDYDALEPGHAAIMKVDGEDVAAFKDEQGKVHAVSAVCTHMGCLVGWNATDRTWDCPCHGSRFELSGQVIHGPATAPLGAKITG